MDVDTRLVEVLRPRRPCISDGSGLRDADPEDPARGAGVPWPDSHQDPHRAGTHQVESCLVGGATSDDDRDLELADKALQVERLDRLGNVFGRHNCPLDHEQVQLCVEQRFGVLSGALRRQRRASHDTGRLDLAYPGGHELGLHGLGVNLLHPRRRLIGGEMGDLLEIRVRVVVARPEALEVEDADPAELADPYSRRGADDAVHSCPHQRELEAEGVDLPRDIHVLRVPCPPARDDRNVVEAVSLPPCFALTYLDFHSACLSYASRCCQHASLLGSGPPPRHDRADLSQIRGELSASGSGARQADSHAGRAVGAGRFSLPMRGGRGRRLSR